MLETVSCVKETCWKPCLSEINWMKNDSNVDGEGNAACNADDETEAAVCECLQQYIHHYISVCSHCMAE